MIGIPAYQEEKNIGKLLSKLIEIADSEIRAIYIVSSGSKDKTNEIVTSFMKKDSRIRLIAESERQGKTSALNILLQKSESYDIMVFMGADNLPDDSGITILLNRIIEGHSDIVGARPVPINENTSFSGFCSHLLWNLHHEISSNPLTPKISGELMAFRTGVIKQLPPAIINDDMYIQLIFQRQGSIVEYFPESKVFLRGTLTLGDMIRQRRRIFVGHRQIRFLFGKKIPTMSLRWGQLMKAIPSRGWRSRFYVAFFILIQSLSFVLSVFDFYFGNLPFKWEMAETTKTLTQES
jgi:glycosyltransferase involved in cell wall biosynthesis